MAGPAEVASRGPSPGTSRTASNAPAPPPSEPLLPFSSWLRASSRLLCNDRVSSPPTSSLTMTRARSISSVATRIFDSRMRSVTWLVSTNPRIRMTREDSARLDTTTRTCRERRQVNPTARLSAFSPRTSGADRR
ncbi:Uncharacterised protein [Mycobacteroides abscessus subsp. abscessus]|nr:Uncharacterised protein [Mycobacteroides abscessus subsp. abscessus]